MIFTGPPERARRRSIIACRSAPSTDRKRATTNDTQTNASTVSTISGARRLTGGSVAVTELRRPRERRHRPSERSPVRVAPAGAERPRALARQLEVLAAELEEPLHRALLGQELLGHVAGMVARPRHE